MHSTAQNKAYALMLWQKTSPAATDVGIRLESCSMQWQAHLLMISSFGDITQPGKGVGNKQYLAGV